MVVLVKTVSKVFKIVVVLQGGKNIKKNIKLTLKQFIKNEKIYFIIRIRNFLFILLFK